MMKCGTIGSCIIITKRELYSRLKQYGLLIEMKPDICEKFTIDCGYYFMNIEKHKPSYKHMRTSLDSKQFL